MTLRQLEMEGVRALAGAGIGEAELDAHLLLLEAFGLDETHYLLERMGPAGEEADAAAGGGSKAAHFREMIARRAERIPLQQILGRQEFMGLTFEVNEHVLIPRQDTETIVELVLAEQRDTSKKVLDLCTGTGCIAISLAVRGGYSDVTAADLSPEALAVAERNARRLLAGGWEISAGGEARPAAGAGPVAGAGLAAGAGPASETGLATGVRPIGEIGLAAETGTSAGAGSVPAGIPTPKDVAVCAVEDMADTAGCKACKRQLRLYQGDLFSALPEGGRYDILVSNPPYIPAAEIDGLQPEVCVHEPRMALDGEEDGLAFYRRIAMEAPDWLEPDGTVYLEIGCDQAEAVCTLFEEAGFTRMKVFQDLRGLDRAVRAAWMPPERS